MVSLRQYIQVPIAALLMLAGVSETHGQRLFLISEDTTLLDDHDLIMLEGGGNLRSNFLDNQFMQKLALGGTIGFDNRERVASSINEINRAGGWANSGVTYFHRGKLSWTAGVSTHFDLGVSIPEDLYRLTFDGNYNYRGKVADLSGTQARYMAFQKVSFGMVDWKTFSSVRISFVNGQDFARLDTDRLEVYTSAIGDSLRVDYDGALTVSDPDNTGLGASNGAGFSLDANLNFPLADDKGWVRLSIENLGIIDWNDKTTGYVADSSWLFRGIEITDLMDQNYSDLSSPVLEDSISYQESQGRMTTSLPMSVGMELLAKQANGNYLEFGMQVRPNTPFLPLVYGGYHYLPNPNTAVFVRMSVGGYGRLRVGAGVEKFWRGWYFTAETGDLPGLILEDLKGKGAWIKLGRTIF